MTNNFVSAMEDCIYNLKSCVQDFFAVTLIVHGLLVFLYKMLDKDS